MSSRIFSLDLLKGLAIIGIIIIHSLVYAIFTPDPVLLDELIARASPLLMIVLLPIIFLSSWYILFLFVNGFTVALSFVKEQQKEDPNYKEVLYRKLLNGLVLVVLGAFYGPVLSFTQYDGRGLGYSLITGSLITQRWAGFDWHRLYQHSLFAGIGYCGMIVAIFSYLVMTGKRKISFYPRSLAIAMVCWLALSFLMEWIFGYYDLADYFLEQPEVVQELVARVYGRRTSFFPAFSFAFAGAVFGSFFSPQEETVGRRTKIVRYGLGGGTVILVLSVLGLILSHPDLATLFVGTTYPMFLLSINLGLVMMLTTYFLLRFDIIPSRRTSWKVVIERFSRLSMSIYALEAVIAALFKWVWEMIFGSGIFPWNLGVNLVFIAMLLIFWHGMLVLWEKWGYVGSFEWLTVRFIHKMGSRTSRLE